MPVGSHSRSFSDNARAPSPCVKARLERAGAFLAPVSTQTSTAILAVPWAAESGLPSSISFSLPDDGGCVLVASWLNKPAKRAPGKKPISPVTHLLHACRHGVARHPSCGLRAVRHSCMTVCSSVPPAMYPEVPSGAFISLQGIAVAKHVSISALPSTVFVASFLL